MHTLVEIRARSSLLSCVCTSSRATCGPRRSLGNPLISIGWLVMGFTRRWRLSSTSAARDGLASGETIFGDVVDNENEVVVFLFCFCFCFFFRRPQLLFLLLLLFLSSPTSLFLLPFFFVLSFLPVRVRLVLIVVAALVVHNIDTFPVHLTLFFLSPLHPEVTCVLWTVKWIFLKVW